MVCRSHNKSTQPSPQGAAPDKPCMKFSLSDGAPLPEERRGTAGRRGISREHRSHVCRWSSTTHLRPSTTRPSRTPKTSPKIMGSLRAKRASPASAIPITTGVKTTPTAAPNRQHKTNGEKGRNWNHLGPNERATSSCGDLAGSLFIRTNVHTTGVPTTMCRRGRKARVDTQHTLYGGSTVETTGIRGRCGRT